MAALSSSNGTGLLTYELTNLWNGDPIPEWPEHKINATFTLQGVANVLTISVLASFYGDPSPPEVPGEEDKYYGNLWRFERAETYFYSSENKTYLQVLLSPHGHYMVLLFNGAKNIINIGLTHLEYNATIDAEAGTWKGEVAIPVDLLPPKTDHFMAAYVHGRDDQEQVETLFPLGGDKPDIHQPEKFVEIDLDRIFSAGFRQQRQLSNTWQSVLEHPTLTHQIFYMWNGSKIEDDHDTHNGHHCVFFLKGVKEGVSIEVNCPFFNDTKPDGKPGPTDKLWNHEVAELFFLAADANGTNRYIEIELGPHGHHIVLIFDGYNNNVAKLLPLDYKATIDNLANAWSGSTIIPEDYFPPGVNKFMTTAIHNTGKTPEEVKYEVMSPMPGESANFHRLEQYVDINFNLLLPTNENATLSSIWTNALANPIKESDN